MRNELQRKCDLFLQNKDVIRPVFKWDDDSMALASSILFTAMNMEVTEQQLREAVDTFNACTKAFSDFRSNVKIPLVCKMALADNAEGYFRNVEIVYNLLNRSKWIGSEHKIMAAMAICDHVGGENSQYYVDRTNEIYKRMKEKHKFLTSDEDMPFAALLAVTDMDIDRLIEETELCYEECKDTFKDQNARQTLSHVLALNHGPADAKCRKTEDLYKLLKAEKHKFGSGFDIAVLGTLSSLEVSVETIVADIIDADNYLKQQKGFGDFWMGSERRRMFAALMVMDSYRPGDQAAETAVLGSTLALIMQMELCMILMMTTVVVTSN